MYETADDPTPSAVSRDLAKAHLRVTHAQEDLLIDTYIQSATQFVESFTGLRFVKREVVLQSSNWDPRWKLPHSTQKILSLRVGGELWGSDLLAVILRDNRLAFTGHCLLPVETRLLAGYAGGVADVLPKHRAPILAAVSHLYTNREGQDYPAGVYAQMRSLRGLRL